MPINKGNNKGHATRSLSSVTSRYIYVPLLCLHACLVWGYNFFCLFQEDCGHAPLQEYKFLIYKTRLTTRVFCSCTNILLSSPAVSFIDCKHSRTALKRVYLEVQNLQERAWEKGCDHGGSTRRYGSRNPKDTMSLGRPQVKKNPLSRRETNVPQKPKVWEAEWETFPGREPIPKEKRAKENPRLKEPGKVAC